MQTNKPSFWSTRNIIIIAVVVVVLLSCGVFGFGALMANNGGSESYSGVSSNTAHSGPTATPTATPKPKAWVTIKHFSGSGNTQSDTFDVKNGDHIIIDCTTNSDANLLIADLYAKGTSPNNDLPWAELTTPRANEPCSKQTYTVQQGDASVYLYVQADSVNWTVDVQRYQ